MELSHIDGRGNAIMVDVSCKKNVLRTATASGTVFMHSETVTRITGDKVRKGDVLACARIAGIMAAKKTSELIPLCHNIALDKVSIELEAGDDRITIVSNVVSSGRTGVEMEALTAVATAALTIYDMCKAIDKNMALSDIRLIEKSKKVME
jgi:cyclic pyranopterin monophosphate synthase